MAARALRTAPAVTSARARPGGGAPTPIAERARLRRRTHQRLFQRARRRRNRALRRPVHRLRLPLLSRRGSPLISSVAQPLRRRTVIARSASAIAPTQSARPRSAAAQRAGAAPAPQTMYAERARRPRVTRRQWSRLRVRLRVPRRDQQTSAYLSAPPLPSWWLCDRCEDARWCTTSRLRALRPHFLLPHPTLLYAVQRAFHHRRGERPR